MSELKVTFVIESQEDGNGPGNRLIVLTAPGDSKPRDLALEDVRNQVHDKLGVPEGWKFVSEEAEVTDEKKTKVSDVLIEDKKIKVKLAQTPTYIGGAATYLLHFKFPDQDELISRRFELDAKPGAATLSQIRTKVEPAGGNSLRKDKANWEFVYTGAGPVKDEDKATLVDVSAPKENTSEGKTTFTATVNLKVVLSGYSDGPAKYALTFKFEGETKPYKSVISLDVGPEKATLKTIREKVDTKEISLRDDKIKWKFTYPDGGEVKNEEMATLTDISDPVEETISGSTTFKATVNASAKKRGTWDGKPTITDVKLIEAIKSGEAKEIPVKFPEMPEGKAITDVNDFKAWHQLGEDQKFTVANHVARIYNGFNLPNLLAEIIDAKPYDQFTSKSVGLRQLERYKISANWVVGQKKGKVSGANPQEETYAETSSGYTRLAVEKKRNLAVTTAAKVTVPEYGSVEAEYSRAEATATSNTEENLFLMHVSWVPKAEVTLPFGTDGNAINKEVTDNDLLRNYRFEWACDAANTADDLYQILEDWGALIATKITIGGAYFFANVQKISTDFSEEQITNAWNIKVQGSVSGVDIGAQNTGNLTEFQQKQFDQQYSHTIKKAIGGVEELALNKQYGEWLGTLSKVDLWKPLSRSGILPIYVILDDYRKKRFARILAEGGEANWQKNNVCKSLKYTNFKWYISFGQQSTNSRLD